MRRIFAAIILAAAGFWSQSASAADPAVEPAFVAPPVLDQAFFGFAGKYTQETLGGSFDPFHADFDDITAVGIGYQQFVAQLPLNVRFGYEVGVAGRFADESRYIPGNTADFWAGGLLRYDGFNIFDTVHVAAALTFGFSAVTDSAGYERQREITKDGDASFLFYLGPEVSLSLANHPEFELFGRIHHRSGGGGLLGDMNEGANAPVVGLRVFF